jgi:hypothetical protein
VHRKLFLWPTGCVAIIPDAAGIAEVRSLTVEEEVYAESLWTVHSATKAWAIDLDFG